MKKTVLIIAVLFCTFTASTAQDKKVNIDSAKVEKLSSVKVVGDTAFVLQHAKVIEIAGKKYSYEQFTKAAPVFLSVEAWNAVLEIINTRDYGKLAATLINQIIQAIGQQLPRQNQ